MIVRIFGFKGRAVFPRGLFIFAVLFFAKVSLAAVPTEAEIRVFNDEIQAERTQFESDLRKTLPPKRARDAAAFHKKRVDEAAAFQAGIQDLAPERQEAAIADFQAKRLLDTAAFEAELKKAGPESTNLQQKRKEFDRKMLQKIQAFYDR